METFRFETSLDEWETLRNCWKIIEQQIKSDSNLSNLHNCSTLLTNKLFNNRGSNNNEIQLITDISIETMNNLMIEIENELIINENETKMNNNDNTQNTLKMDEMSKDLIQFIETPVKKYFPLFLLHDTNLFFFFFYSLKRQKMD